MERENLIELFKHEDTIPLAIEINKVHRWIPYVYGLSMRKPEGVSPVVFMSWIKTGFKMVDYEATDEMCHNIGRALGYINEKGYWI